MAKFLHLVGNEWKKQFSRVATWVMLVLLVLGTIFFSLVSGLSERIISYVSNEESFWQSDLEYNRQYADEVDRYGNPTSYALDCKVKVAYYTYLIDHGVKANDWRYTTGLVMDMAEASVRGSAEETARLTAILDRQDTKGYYEWRLEQRIAAEPALESIYRWATEYLIANDVTPSESDWRWETVNEITDAKVTLLKEEKLQKEGSVDYSESRYNKAKETELLGLYRLEHNQKSNPADAFDGRSSGDGFWDVMVSSLTLITLVGLVCIVIGGSIVANEFSAGTIKFLLIAPVKRWKILMSKYAATLLIGAAASALIFLLTFLLSLAFTGGDGAFLPALSIKGGAVVKSSPYLRLLGLYLLAGVKVVVMTTLAFAFSSLLHSAALAIGVSMFAYLTGNLIVSILQLMNLDFARYLLFANMDFAAIVQKSTGFVHHSLPAAILIVVLHMVVFLWTAWDGFVRREV